MLNQAPGDQQELAKLFHISQDQMSYISNADAGCGLIRYGSTLIPFENRFPRDRMEPALRHHIAHRTLEHMVRKRSEDGRVEACLPPRLEF